MSRRNRKRVNKVRSNDDVNVATIEEVAGKISKEIDDLLIEYKRRGKKFDLLYIIKLVAAKYSMEYYNKAISDVYCSTFDQSVIARLYSDSFASSNTISSMIKSEKNV